MSQLAQRPTPSLSEVPAPRRVHLTEKISLKHHNNEVWDVSFSHDGTRLASSGADKTTIIYSVDTLEVLHSLEGHSAGIGCASWSPDDTMIVTCSQDSSAIVWDTATGKPLQTLTGFNGPVTSCAWLPSSQEFVTTSLSCLELYWSLCLWSVSSLDPICLFPKRYGSPPVPLLGCILLSDNRVASFDNKRNVYIHNIPKHNIEAISTTDVNVSSMCTSRLGKPYALILRNDGLIEMVDLKSMSSMGNPLKVFKMKSYGTFVIKATFGGKNEEFVASGSEDGDVYIWDTETGEFLLKQKVHTKFGSCNGVAWNPKRHNMIATAGDDCTVRILSIDDEDDGWEHIRFEDAVIA